MAKNSRIAGFTIVELMIAIAIIAVISTIALAAYRYYIRTSSETAIDAALEEIYKATRLYVESNGRLPGSMANLGLPTQDAGLAFTVKPVQGASNQAQIVSLNGSSKVPFVVNLQNEGDKLCWDCVGAGQAGLPAELIANNAYLPEECRRIDHNGCGHSIPSTPPGSTPTSTPSVPTPNNQGTNGTAPTPNTAPQAPQSCSASEDVIDVNGHPACAPKCPPGTVRNPVHKLQCDAASQSPGSSSGLTSPQTTGGSTGSGTATGAPAQSQPHRDTNPPVANCHYPYVVHPHDPTRCCNAHDNRHHDKCPK